MVAATRRFSGVLVKELAAELNEADRRRAANALLKFRARGSSRGLENLRSLALFHANRDSLRELIISAGMDHMDTLHILHSTEVRLKFN